MKTGDYEIFTLISSSLCLTGKIWGGVYVKAPRGLNTINRVHTGYIHRKYMIPSVLLRVHISTYICSCSFQNESESDSELEWHSSE